MFAGLFSDPEGKVSFRNLHRIFQTGTPVYWYDQSQVAVGGEVVSLHHQKAYMLQPGFITLGIRSLISNGTKFFELDFHRRIFEYNGSLKFDELPCIPLEKGSDIYRKLQQRGCKIVKYTKGIHHLHYNGHLLKRSVMGTRRVRSIGRVMVDHKSFAQFCPNHMIVNMGRGKNSWADDMAGGLYRGGSQMYDVVPEEKLYMCWPTVLVFSLRAKTWGEALVEGLADIEFEENAFEQLVRPENEKRLIQTLVKQTFNETDEKLVGHQGVSKKDFIVGKGGGACFLLHGNPGTGKTLTAESLAETMKRPLYTVSVGELGITAGELEHNLEQILELASIWEAIILLDEADIFLEKRSINDINRCALVGVFLRMLEYHDGIIFLTTNRVQCFDPAFKSRISMSLHYQDLSGDGRTKVWKQLSDATIPDQNGDSKKSQLDFKELGSKYDLNGRQIRTCLRLSRALAETENQTIVTMKHVADTAKIVQALDGMGNAYACTAEDAVIPVPASAGGTATSHALGGGRASGRNFNGQNMKHNLMNQIYG